MVVAPPHDPGQHEPWLDRAAARVRKIETALSGWVRWLNPDVLSETGACRLALRQASGLAEAAPTRGLAEVRSRAECGTGLA